MACGVFLWLQKARSRAFCGYSKLMRYEHDPAKLAANVARHRVWFHEAEGFEWETADIKADDRKRYGETRFQATGYIGLRLYVMVFTLRGAAVRLISLRKANPREMNCYGKT